MQQSVLAAEPPRRSEQAAHTAPAKPQGKAPLLKVSSYTLITLRLEQVAHTHTDAAEVTVRIYVIETAKRIPRHDFVIV